MSPAEHSNAPHVSSRSTRRSQPTAPRSSEDATQRREGRKAEGLSSAEREEDLFPWSAPWRSWRLGGSLIFLCALGACGTDDSTVVVDLASALDGERTATIERTIEIDSDRAIEIRAGDSDIVVEAWLDDGMLAGRPDAQDAAGANPSWLAPYSASGTIHLTARGDGEHTLRVWARGTPAPPATRDRSLTWFDGALLDDPSIISFAQVMAAAADDGHGGTLLWRWFEEFVAGPGAGRATFQQFLDGVAATQGPDPASWDLAALPFKVTGVHDRIDLAQGEDCGELRVSVASTDATFSPVHLIFLFRQPAREDDATPDGVIHCRGTARRWARLAGVEASAWPAAARAVIADGITHEQFLMVESVELSISPWQWRQWVPDGAGSFSNPRLFQTIDLDRVSAAGPTRDAFLAAVAANTDAIAARTWRVPDAFRAQVAEVQPNVKAGLVDVSSVSSDPSLPRALGMIGCPRCHTDDADFVQTGIDRRPSPFYDRELDARAARLDELAGDGWPSPAPFGPLQPL